MRALLSLMILTIMSGATSAQTIQRIDITEFGVYQAKETGQTAAPGTAVGSIGSVDVIKLVQATATVPARLGVHFGFRYKIIGGTGRAVTLKVVTLVPQPGIRNPNTGNTTVREEYSVKRTVGETNYTDYSFDNPWEIVIGTWTKEIWEDDRKLVSQSFNVVAP